MTTIDDEGHAHLDVVREDGHHDDVDLTLRDYAVALERYMVRPWRRDLFKALKAAEARL